MSFFYSDKSHYGLAIGNATKDVEKKGFEKNGRTTYVSKIDIATHKDENGEQVFTRIVCFSRLAHHAANIKKGDLVRVDLCDGKPGSYENRNTGETVNYIEYTAEFITPLGKSEQTAAAPTEPKKAIVDKDKAIDEAVAEDLDCPF